jgi:hypothetical protein
MEVEQEMRSCFGCGTPTVESRVVDMYRVLSSSEEHHIASTTTTTRYETTSLRVPFCSECSKKEDRYGCFVSLGVVLSIGSIYYLWHLYLPNFFEISADLGFGMLAAYALTIGVLFFACHRISSSMSGHVRSPSDHPEIQRMLSAGWKKGSPS